MSVSGGKRGGVCVWDVGTRFVCMCAYMYVYSVVYEVPIARVFAFVCAYLFSVHVYIALYI